MDAVRNASSTAIVALAVVATVLVPCLCAVMPAVATADHGCCPDGVGLAPAAPDCCACAITPLSDSAVTAAAAHHSPPATLLTNGPWTVPPSAPAVAPAIVRRIAPSPPPLRV